MKIETSKFSKYIVFFLIAIMECLYFKLFSYDNENIIFAYFIILINTVFIGVGLLNNKSKEEKRVNAIILFSYMVRVIVLFLDIFGYTRGFTGVDTETFYSATINEIVFRHNYVSFLKFLTISIGNSRIILEYFNVIVSLLTLLIIKKVMLIVNKDSLKNIELPLAIFAFAPSNILLSASLLRETVMIFLNTVSILFFIKWYTNGNKYNFILSCFFIVLSSWFHSGMLLALAAYSIFYIIYNPKLNKICIHKNTILSIVLIIIIILAFYRLFGNSITSYFNRVTTLEDVARKRDSGSTDYLSFLNNTKSIPLIIICTPLKILYFYFSPMPWNCYSLSVASVFLFSSSIYIFLFYKIFRKRTINKGLKKQLIVILLLLSIAYAWGTSNAGTAMRHREKMLPYIVVMYSLTINRNDRRNKDE